MGSVDQVHSKVSGHRPSVRGGGTVNVPYVHGFPGSERLRENIGLRVRTVLTGNMGCPVYVTSWVPRPRGLCPARL